MKKILKIAEQIIKVLFWIICLFGLIILGVTVKFLSRGLFGEAAVGAALSALWLIITLIVFKSFAKIKYAEVKSSQYPKFYENFEDNEIILDVVIGEISSVVVYADEFYILSVPVIAFYDPTKGELINHRGKLEWIVKNWNSSSFKRKGFSSKEIYRVLVRRQKPESVIPLQSSEIRKYNYYVKKVIKKNHDCPRLKEVLKKYCEPIVIYDEFFGKLSLDKQLQIFVGKYNLLGSHNLGGNDIDINISVKAEEDWQTNITKAKKLLQNPEEFIRINESFAADELLEIANDWRTEENAEEITKDNFIQRISLDILETDGEEYSLWYDDDDMFWGHTIIVYGSLEEGPNSADIIG